MGDAADRNNYRQFRKIYRFLKDDRVRQKKCLFYANQISVSFCFGIYKRMLLVHMKIYNNLKHYIAITFLIQGCYNKIFNFCFR